MADAHEAGRTALKQKLRLARHLLKGPAALEESASSEGILLRLAAGGALSADRCVLDEMRRDGLLVYTGIHVALSDAGVAFGRRAHAQFDPFRAQHADLSVQSLDAEEGRTAALVNAAESPLTKLAQRRNRNGEPFLSPREVRAGERLRVDYTRAQIMPRLGANWDGVGTGGRRRGAGGVNELTDMALAARQRVEKALVATGPELSGVLIDACCFLKGLERIESERGWPVRSAKVVLKTALSVLSRHYEPPAEHRQGRTLLHWGAEDYRPTLAMPGGN